MLHAALSTTTIDMHINPDHFLQTDKGRVINADLNKVAWQKAHLALSNSLLASPKPARLYLLIGPQGAGKSTWAKARLLTEPGTVIFDAILVKRSEREPLILAARQHGVEVIAAWFTSSLECCLARNNRRPHDEVVPESAIKNVFNALQPPQLSEGFADILRVDA